MSITSRPRPIRRLGALALVPLVMLLSACGMRADLTIHSDDTADMSVLVWDSTGTLTESDCSESEMSSYGSPLPNGVTAEYTFTDHDGDPACQITASNLPLSDMTGGSATLVHKDGTYEINLPMDGMSGDMGSMGNYIDELSYSVTFPGKVTEASGGAKVDGNTVTWDLTSETEDLHAIAEDGGSSFPWLWIILGLVVIAAIGAVVVIVLMTQKKKGAGAPPAGAPFGQPAQQPYQSFPQQGPGQVSQPQGFGQAGAPQGYGQPATGQSGSAQGYSQPQAPQSPSYGYGAAQPAQSQAPQAPAYGQVPEQQAQPPSSGNEPTEPRQPGTHEA